MPDTCADPQLPAAADVAVVGAGPAGSACALALARAGHQVLLLDQHRFPRDKVCGDGLIPDAHRALQQLGLLGPVMAAARRAPAVGCIGPRGGRVEVPGNLAMLPRRALDDLLKRGAEAAGARFFAPWRLRGALTQTVAGEARTVGLRLQAEDGSEHALHARWVVLATGANPKALQAMGVCERHTPSGVALRGYVHHPGMAARLQTLDVVWHPRLRRGYGWIFPAPGDVFNIGVGLAHSHAKGDDGHASMQAVNLRALFQTFCEVHPPAAELLRGGRWWLAEAGRAGEPCGDPRAAGTHLKGAPLRCSLEGAAFSAPGLLVAGEAAGSTYAFTGEGIGKAMETGLLAAECIGRALAAAPSASAPADALAQADALARAQYGQAMVALKPRFDLYERANKVNDHPWLADLLIWRAQRSPRILRRMQGVLEETGNPGNLVSARGLLRLVLPLR